MFYKTIKLVVGSTRHFPREVERSPQCLRATKNSRVEPASQDCTKMSNTPATLCPLAKRKQNADRHRLLHSWGISNGGKPRGLDKSVNRYWRMIPCSINICCDTGFRSANGCTPSPPKCPRLNNQSEVLGKPFKIKLQCR